ncbi:MAG: glycerol-3-phosphate 1-O-acyltransferase PlsB [Pseudomonadales bacterium]|nr:glycerol-3-phosphate 1-O-acyltransferase PlsB [Pseudomonadales bacterium]
MRLLGLGNFFFWLARKILYLWVRTQVFPEDLGELQLDHNQPICYVLQTRFFSNLLVIDRETRRQGLPRAMRPMQGLFLHEESSVFFLLRGDHAGPLRQNRFTYSPRLLRLMEAVYEHQELDVQLVPVSILWGRAPDKESSILKILFADSWATPGAFKQFIAILLHGRNTMVRFSEPISLRSMAESTSSSELALRKLSRVLRVHFRRQREVAIGPDLSHRRTLVSAIMNAQEVQEGIRATSRQDRIGDESAERRARSYIHEIAADYSYPIIRLYEIFLTWLWTRLYDGVDVQHLDQVAELAETHEIIYVPCHRSHIDYLLLSYVIFRRGLMTPHIAAGANLNMPIVGPILRRGGAFFLRRSFKNNPLYGAVFNEYLHVMISKGYSIEYFIEGGRSRTGRLLSPRTGMLSMTVLSFLRDHARPIVFIPAYIGYEKLMEGRTYVGELLGQPKRKESLLQVIGTIRRLKKTFGKVHLSFGDPIYLAGLLDQCHPGWKQEEDCSQSPWVADMVETLARRIATSINAAAVVNPMNLISLALLATQKHAMDIDMLAQQIELYKKLLSQAPYSDHITVTALSGDAIIRYAEQLKSVQRRKHPLGDIAYLQEEHAVLLTYFRNNTLHLFTIPSLVGCFLLHNIYLRESELKQMVCNIYPFLQTELFLRWSDNEVDGAIQTCIDVLVSNGLFLRNDQALSLPNPNSAEFAYLKVLSGAVAPNLERYFMTVALLTHMGSGSVDQKRLEELCSLLAQRLSILHEFNAPEFFDKALFRNFIITMQRMGLIGVNEQGLLTFDETLLRVAQESRSILDAGIRQTIVQMTRLDDQEIAAALGDQRHKLH